MLLTCWSKETPSRHLGLSTGRERIKARSVKVGVSRIYYHNTRQMSVSGGEILAQRPGTCHHLENEKESKLEIMMKEE